MFSSNDSAFGHYAKSRWTTTGIPWHSINGIPRDSTEKSPRHTHTTKIERQNVFRADLQAHCSWVTLNPKRTLSILESPPATQHTHTHTHTHTHRQPMGSTLCVALWDNTTVQRSFYIQSLSESCFSAAPPSSSSSAPSSSSFLFRCLFFASMLLFVSAVNTSLISRLALRLARVTRLLSVGTLVGLLFLFLFWGTVSASSETSCSVPVASDSWKKCDENFSKISQTQVALLRFACASKRSCSYSQSNHLGLFGEATRTRVDQQRQLLGRVWNERGAGDGLWKTILGTLNTTFEIENVNVNINIFFYVLWFFHIWEELLPSQNIFEQNWPKTKVCCFLIFLCEGFQSQHGVWSVSTKSRCLNSLMLYFPTGQHRAQKQELTTGCMTGPTLGNFFEAGFGLGWGLGRGHWQQSDRCTATTRTRGIAAARERRNMKELDFQVENQRRAAYIARTMSELGKIC